jgi:hypothetical protein
MKYLVFTKRQGSEGFSSGEVFHSPNRREAEPTANAQWVFERAFALEPARAPKNNLFSPFAYI